MTRLFQSNPARPLRKWCLLPDGWDDTWRAARAASATSPARIAMYGDSQAIGIGTTNWVANAYPGRLKAAFQAAGYTWGGDYWPATYTGSLTGSYTWQGTPPWTLTTTGGIFAWLPGGYSMLPSWTDVFTATTRASFATPYACTDMDIVYYDSGSATPAWAYSLDGGADTTVNGTGDTFVKRVSFTGLSNATHTLALRRQTAQWFALWHGVATYNNRNAGIQLARIIHTGQAMAEIGRVGSPSDMAGLLSGPVPPSSVTGFGFPAQPHLLIIASGANDVSNLFGLDNFRETVRRLLRGARRGVDNASLIILANCYPDGVSSDVTGMANGQSYSWYVDAMRSVAEEFNGAFVNAHAMFGENPLAKGWMTSSTDLHFTDTGNQAVADLLAALIV